MHVKVLCRLSYSYFYILQEPLKLDIVISFPDHGFHLRFDPWSQVLPFSGYFLEDKCLNQNTINFPNIINICAVVELTY